MSELLDKQVYVPIEIENNVPGFTLAHESPQKVCDENERNK